MPASAAWVKWFALIWVGQVFSQVGSFMTAFGIGLWAWDQTGQAAPMALVLLSERGARLFASVFAGHIVDRFDRKRLLFLSDTVAGLSTLWLLSLLLSGSLGLWQVYAATALAGFFGYIQSLTYSVSLTTLVPPEHHSRAVGWVTVAGQLGTVIAPAIAALLYEQTSLAVIMTIDLVTFTIALGTLHLFPSTKVTQSSNTLKSASLIYGVRYILERSGLRATVSFLIAYNFFSTGAFALIGPMILAKTNDSETTLGIVRSMIGIGGIAGGITLGLWHVSERKMNMLLCTIITICMARLVLGISDSVIICLIAGLVAGFFTPFPGNANQSIWMRKVEPTLQGRVFAARYLLAQTPASVALLIVGPLADHVFVPFMGTQHALAQAFEPVFGSGSAAGFALLFTLLTASALILALASFGWRTLYTVETNEPDSEHIIATRVKLENT